MEWSSQEDALSQMLGVITLIIDASFALRDALQGGRQSLLRLVLRLSSACRFGNVMDSRGEFKCKCFDSSGKASFLERQMEPSTSVSAQSD